MNTMYDGPIIDTHQHFWTLAGRRHPWLAPGVRVPHRYGDYEAIKHDYLPDDYRRDAAGHDVIGTVYVEAEWDPATPLDETRFVTELAREYGLPNAMAAQAWLDAADVSEVLAAQRRFALVRSVRHKPAHAHASPGNTLMSNGRWRDGYAQLAQHGLHFELQTPWHHLREAATLARDFPETLLIVNHAGVPGDRSAATLHGWREALAPLAARPNTAVKVSGLCEAGKPWSVDANREVLATLHDLFGAERLMFGSNFPVDGLFLSLDALLTGFKTLVAAWSAAEQRAFFHDTAMRVYRPIGL
ncbi:amidohydrolase family protein [Paraburkholderia acidisoli]|uniref:Amidohydrolase family protein n=1 Tax=Paraburkholderia acidisoli TaxID=2571748 RepID=A0A7Z2GMP9_9BURK|nr:amidohydrolase family protein [Paraburkholderia acidisoli]QGZ64650.1 amidohydrolase family protein [Paraburkholderia acidisoli]